jgi:hypothetical protein
MAKPKERVLESRNVKHFLKPKNPPDSSAESTRRENISFFEQE